jgi:hypothetical protein
VLISTAGKRTRTEVGDEEIGTKICTFTSGPCYRKNRHRSGEFYSV